MNNRIIVGLAVLFFAVLSLPAAWAESGRKNVILIIGDGCGHNTLYAAADYVTGEPQGFPFQKWTHLGCSTYAINGGYNPETIWKTFDAHRENPTDSAASGSAINTGKKTKSGRISTDENGDPVETFAEMCHKNGFATGTVTSVGISHATPATVAAHDLSRGNGQVIFHNMLFESNLDVMIGSGHPIRRDNCDIRDERRAKYQSYGPNEEDWKKIESGELPEGFVFVDSKEGFQKIASGEVPPPRKLLGLTNKGSITYNLKGQPASEKMPTLAEISLAALAVLNQSEKGFYLQIEEGVIDWTNHDRNLENNIAQCMALNDTVEAVCAWVEKNSSWDETLVIITADHATGAFWGLKADEEGTLYATPVWKGKGNLAEGQYYSKGHTNELVPFYLRGRCAQKVDELVRGTDKRAAELYRFDGRYIDNTDIITLMRNAMGIE
ncbi:MAG: alkaline phosphatase [Planctomycetia bacterium]|nr:alkaline phosphatase [Planctomycetia bacterium]